MTRRWEDNAHEFGALTKQGVDVRLAVLVACSVERGKGGPRTVANATVSAREFAEKAGSTADRVLRHLEAWEKCADAGFCSPSADLTPDDAADADLRVPTQEQFAARFDATGSGSRPRDSRPEHAAQIIEKRGAGAVVDMLTPAQRVEVARAVAKADPVSFDEAVRTAGGNPDMPPEPIGDGIGIELKSMASRMSALVSDAQRVLRRAEPDQQPRYRSMFEKPMGLLSNLVFGQVPDTIEEMHR